MSRKSFAGTVTIGVNVFNVTGTLIKQGLRVQGTLVFTADPVRVMPINVFIDSLGTSFTTPANQFFLDPNGDTVRIDPILIADSAIDTAFTAMDLVATPIEINAVPDTMDMNIDEVADTSSIGFVDEDEEISPATLRSLEPIRINEVGNQFDHFGSLLSTPRLPEEKNKAYLSRILSVAGRPSNSTYVGLTNGINRELGLAPAKAIKITTKASPLADPLKMRLFLNEKEATIYTEWVPQLIQEAGATPVVEQTIEYGDMTIGALIDWINLSDNYEATLASEATSAARHLLVTDSRLLHTETLPSQEVMELEYDKIVEGSLSFNPSPELRVEVGVTPVARGEYQVDYTNGKITAFTQPGRRIEFTYTSNRDEFYIWHSPVKVIDITSEGGQDIYFNQVTREFYTNEVNHYVNGLPNNEGYGIIRDILTAGEFPQFWGE
jgi:hypothetical protein